MSSTARVLRVLEMKFARGLFEHPYLEEKPLTQFTAAQHPQSLELARQSAVLLKNDGILPLDAKAKRRVAVIGRMRTRFTSSSATTRRRCARGRASRC